MEQKKKTSVPARKRGRPRKITETRGGKREGAGRKPWVAPEEKRVQISLYVSPANKAIMAQLREKGVNLSAEFEKVVEKLAKVLC